MEDGETCIAVPSNDPEALARAMDRISGGNGLRETLGQNARKRYNDLFWPERHIQALLHFFEELIGTGQS